MALDDLAAMARTAILADPDLVAKKVSAHMAGVRLTKNPEPPYIRISVKGGEHYAARQPVVLCFQVVSPSSADRWAIYDRLLTLFNQKRLAKPGLVVLRLVLADVTDNVPERTTGVPSLMALFRGSAVL